MKRIAGFAIVWCLLVSCSALGDLRTDARTCMKRASEFYVNSVAVHGGYVYYYSPDLRKRLGEGVASPTQIWIQPPGTPTVGLAYLEAWIATKDPFYLDAATNAAHALIYGQLKSGAWTNSIDFDPRGQTAAYRNGNGTGRNFSTLDDGISQAAIQLVMKADQAHNFRHARIHDAAQTALDALLNAQFANGAFPQGWDETPNPQQPVIPSRYPDYDWRTEGRVKEYWDAYTLNDGAAGTIAETLKMAYEIYGTERYLTALKKLGDFLVLSQMPLPQPGWAQQYGYQMQPIWARKFEPPAIAGRESQDVLKTLVFIYHATGNDQYLAPIPKALRYLRSSVLPDGRLSRYYELETNRPLYMTRTGSTYSLAYDDSKLPRHYGWKVENELDLIQSMYTAARQSGHEPRQSSTSPAEVRQIVDSLDSNHRWVSRYAGEPLSGQPKFGPGEAYLNSAVFAENLSKLAEFLRQSADSK